MIFFAENERASELLRALSMMRFLREVVREESARAFVAAFSLFSKVGDAEQFFLFRVSIFVSNPKHLFCFLRIRNFP